MYDVLSGQNRAGSRHASLRGQPGMGVTYVDFPGQPLVNSIIANNPAAGPSGLITSGVNSAKCVDVNEGRGIDGTKVQMWDCGGYPPAQLWTFNRNGTITAGGGCLDIYHAVYTDGTNIAWNTCNGGANQQWQAINGQLVNPHSGKCLDDPAANTANGTQLKLYACNGGAWQRWSLSTSIRRSDPVRRQHQQMRRPRQQPSQRWQQGTDLRLQRDVCARLDPQQLRHHHLRRRLPRHLSRRLHRRRQHPRGTPATAAPTSNGRQSTDSWSTRTPASASTCHEATPPTGHS